MKKLLSVLFLSAAIGSSTFAQGGDDCATAMASPITVPFTAAGGTCTGLDDFNNVGVACGVSTYTIGPDWLYYFTATQTGNLQIQLSNMAPQYPWASISLWQGCPNVGTCVGGSVTTSNGLDMCLVVPVTNAQSYFIMIDNWAPPACFTYNINISYPSASSTQPQCTNMDFESGDFTGWLGNVGSITCGAPAAPHPVINAGCGGIPSAHHTIMTGAGLDLCGNFPVVAPGGSFSVKLGDGQTAGNGAATLEQTFIVQQQTANFTYKYAVVVEDATHLPNEQPFFKVEMYDQNNQMINCGQYLVVGGPNIPGFFVAACGFQTYYRPWTTVNVDLSGFVGQPVTIRFIVGDCCYGGHYAYAYVDASCVPNIIQTQNDTICAGESVTLTAPQGSGSYSWSTGATTQTITVSPTTMTVYSCTMSSVSSTTCTTTIWDTIWVKPSPIADFNYQNLNCDLNVNFLDSSYVVFGNANIISWSWNFGDANTSSQQNPNHLYSSSGTYNVSLIVTTDNGCTDTITIPITIYDSVVARFDHDTVCVGYPTTFTESSINCTQWSWNFGDPLSGVNNVSTLQNPTHIFSGPGTYTVTLIAATPGGCPDTLIKTVTVWPKPTAAFSANPNPVSTLDPTVQFTDLTGTAVTWFWDFGDPPATSTIQNPSHTYPALGDATYTYTVTLIVSNQYGCWDTTRLDIVVEPEYSFFAPNCVTPNGDGNNQFFYTYGVGWKTYHLMIFDRWGDLIWQTTDMNQGWDCKVLNKRNLVQEDVYVWKAIVVDVFDKKHEYVGHVTVIR